MATDGLRSRLLRGLIGRDLSDSQVAHRRDVYRT